MDIQDCCLYCKLKKSKWTKLHSENDKITCSADKCTIQTLKESFTQTPINASNELPPG